jgi:hypothetical protein
MSDPTLSDRLALAACLRQRSGATQRNSDDIDAEIATIEGIPNDGGDLNDCQMVPRDTFWIDTEPEIVWP